MTLRERTFIETVAGERLQVRQLSPDDTGGNQPTLVFLHEALGCIAHWRDFPAALVDATGLPALLYDRCGFGGSQPLETPRGRDYLERELASLDALLQRCAVRRPLLVGHSDGATLALLYAASFPDRVAGVVSEAAHLFVEEETLVGIRQAVERWKSTDFKDKLARYHGAKTEQVFSAWTETWLDPRFRSWNIEARMPSVRCPVLALQGDADEFGTVQQLKAICSGVGGPCQTRLIAACGHTPHHQARAEVLAAMVAFIGGISGSS